MSVGKSEGFTCEYTKTRRLFLAFNFHDDFSHIIKMESYHDNECGGWKDDDGAYLVMCS